MTARRAGEQAVGSRGGGGNGEWRGAVRPRRGCGLQRGGVPSAHLGNRLVVRARVGDDEEAWLHELLGDLVGEHAGRVAASDRGRASVLRVLEDGALTVGARRDHAHVRRVLDPDDDARGHHELVVRLAEVDDVDAVSLALPHVAVHLEIEVLGAEVRRAREHHLEIAVLLLLGDVLQVRHDGTRRAAGQSAKRETSDARAGKAELDATDYKWSARRGGDKEKGHAPGVRAPPGQRFAPAGDAVERASGTAHDPHRAGRFPGVRENRRACSPGKINRAVRKYTSHASRTNSVRF